MRGFGASSVSHQHGKGTKCLLFQGIFLGKGLWGKVGHGHVVGHHAVWGKMPLGKSATVVNYCTRHFLVPCRQGPGISSEIETSQRPLSHSWPVLVARGLASRLRLKAIRVHNHRVQ